MPQSLVMVCAGSSVDNWQSFKYILYVSAILSLFFFFNRRAFSIAVSLSMRKGVRRNTFLPQTIDNAFFCPLNYSLFICF